MIAIIALIVSIVVNLATALFVYGRLTERVKTHGERLDSHDGKFEHLEASSQRHEGEIGELYGIVRKRRS